MNFIKKKTYDIQAEKNIPTTTMTLFDLTYYCLVVLILIEKCINHILFFRTAHFYIAGYQFIIRGTSDQIFFFLNRKHLWDNFVVLLCLFVTRYCFFVTRYCFRGNFSTVQKFLPFGVHVAADVFATTERNEMSLT